MARGVPGETHGAFSRGINLFGGGFLWCLSLVWAQVQGLTLMVDAILLQADLLAHAAGGFLAEGQVQLLCLTAASG